MVVLKISLKMSTLGPLFSHSVCLLLSIKYSSPSVSTGHWFQKPRKIPESASGQVAYVKWASAMNTVGVSIFSFGVGIHSRLVEPMDAKPTDTEGRL